MAVNWGFVRKGSDAKAYQDYLSGGIGGILFDPSDPYFAEGWNSAGGANMHRGLWMPASTGNDPVAYAHLMADYANKYHPELLVPNIEFQGKGYKGSAGWDWNEKMMAEFRKLSPQQKLAVSVMGNQDDFNYEAYTNRGADVWAQAYDEKMNPWDPDKLYDQLVRRGVDPSRINMSLAPGGKVGTKAGAYSLYTLDDVNRNLLSRLGIQNVRPMGASTPQTPAGRPTGNFTPMMDPNRARLLSSIQAARR